LLLSLAAAHCLAERAARWAQEVGRRSPASPIHQALLTCERMIQPLDSRPAAGCQPSSTIGANPRGLSMGPTHLERGTGERWEVGKYYSFKWRRVNVCSP